MSVNIEDLVPHLQASLVSRKSRPTGFDKGFPVGGGQGVEAYSGIAWRFAFRGFALKNRQEFVVSLRLGAVKSGVRRLEFVEEAIDRRRALRPVLGLVYGVADPGRGLLQVGSLKTRVIERLLNPLHNFVQQKLCLGVGRRRGTSPEQAEEQTCELQFQGSRPPF